MNRRDPEDDPVADLLLYLGPTGVAILMAVAGAACFCVADRIVSLIFGA
ncbi:hypothetical protein ACFWP0_09310 [Achromobacter sp. NPDC058515]